MLSALKRLVPIALLLAGFTFTGCLNSRQAAADEEREPHFLEGRSRVNAMDYDGAIQSFENALVANPKSASAHFELGWLYDQRKNEPATAIYHYGRFLDAQSSGERAERARLRIVACKQELAKSVSLAPVAQSLQREFDQLTEENRRLREENERWRAYFVRQAGQNGSASGGQISPPPLPAQPFPKINETNVSRVATGTPARMAAQETGTSREGSPSHNVSMKSHTVKSGETAMAIAKKYNIRVETLMAANPRLEPRRMQVGQTLNVPGN